MIYAFIQVNRLGCHVVVNMANNLGSSYVCAKKYHIGKAFETQITFFLF